MTILSSFTTILTFITTIAFLILLIYFAGQPRKRILRSRQDKINAYLDITQRISAGWQAADKFRYWYPEISDEEFNEIVNYCEKIVNEACKIVCQVRDGTLLESDIEAQLAKKYPELNSRVLNLLHNQAFFLTM